ncbi:methyl-accepting chemotaxis protein [Leptospira sp. 96542]|nr:methyl-accepting chemotaxis protein [Leptospira sp. 96542]
MKFISTFRNLNLKTKLLFFSIISAFLIASVLSFTFLWIAEDSTTKSLESQMNNIRDTKVKQVQHYFESKRTDILTLSSSLDVITAFERFEAAYKKLYQNGGRKRAENFLKEKYITQNPYKTGEKDKLEDAGDGSTYSEVHNQFQSYFRSYIKQKLYYDLFLIDLEGNIVYTVFKELDYGTNLLTGEYKDSNIGRLFKTVKNLPVHQAEFIDFEGYAPSYGEPASFIGSPIYKAGRLIGVIITQMPIDEINDVMEDNFIGHSGAIYLIGKDKKFRTGDHRYKNEKFILTKENNSPFVEKAFLGDKGVTKSNDYRGEGVFVAYSKISILGTDYAILAEYEVDKAFAALTEMKWKVLIGFISIVFILLIVTYYVASSISSPILEAVSVLSSSTREIAATVEQQEKTAQMQSASVNQTSTTMAELSASAKHTAEQSSNVSDKSKEAQNSAREGKMKIGEMVNSMHDLQEKVVVISDQILQLSEKNSQIGNIIGLVSDIANQTNMLALNAAVEAARAGEYGKGFAVVAGEIRKLADESKRSADKIQEILTEIRRATDSTVMATEEGNKKVERSMFLGNEAVGSFQSVFDSISMVFTSTEQITLNVKQQSIAISEVVQAMNNLNNGSRETATGITQTKIGIGQVQSATLSLKRIVEGLRK